MVAVIPAVRLVMRIGARLVFVPAAIRTEITVGVIGAIGTVMRIGSRLIVAVGMIRAVLAVPCIVSRSDHTPRMGGVAAWVVLPPGMVPVVAVVRGPVDDSLVDVGVVVVDDVATATAPPPQFMPQEPKPQPNPPPPNPPPT